MTDKKEQPIVPIIEAILYMDKEVVKLRVRSDTGQVWPVELKPLELARIAERWKEIEPLLK